MMKRLLVRAMIGAALIVTLLDGMALSRPAPTASHSALPWLACARTSWLPPGE